MKKDKLGKNAGSGADISALLNSLAPAGWLIMR